MLSPSCTHEKMTRFGSLFFENGKRSGSCFDVHSSMLECSYRIQARPKILRCFRCARDAYEKVTAGGKGRQPSGRRYGVCFLARLWCFYCSNKRPRRRDAMQRKERRSNWQGVAAEYKDRLVAQGAACSAEWAVSMAVRRRQELMDTSASCPGEPCRLVDRPSPATLGPPVLAPR